MTPPFTTVLIANRGEIACRIIRTLRHLGVRTVAVYSEPEKLAQHVRMADEAYCLGPAAADQSYLNVPALLEAARASGAQALHPGYGFLSENADFVAQCEAAGLAFIGPTAEQMRRFGLKHTARALAEAQGVPLPPGSGLLESPAQARAEAERIGYPVMLKSTAGGGGIGMRMCRGAEELDAAFEQVQRLGKSHFKSEGLFLEKYIEQARHIEVQIFGDGAGGVLALGERDCSAQRRNQKVIEETPAPGLSEAQRSELFAAACRLMASVQYRSAGTVEFVFDAREQQFYFLEVNTRLQVEHGVTEEVYGVDLVEWMVRLAAGDATPMQSFVPAPSGHAIQTRIYAEDPGRDFMPCSGELSHVSFPADTRVDAFIASGDTVLPYYDPLLAKLIIHAGTRDAAVDMLVEKLHATRLDGIETNLEYLRQVADSPVFRAGEMQTRTLGSFAYTPPTLLVLAPGNMTTIQDYPGRVGYWAVGVPPSGSMDALAFRLGNRLLENAEDAAGLEIAFTGPTLQFHHTAWICLAGASIAATLDGAPVAMWEPVAVPAGATLTLGNIAGPGARAYLLIRGGFDVPLYLGSRSTFTLGQFGGHGGRRLQKGDVLHFTRNAAETATTTPTLCEADRPHYTHAWEIGVLCGPHTSPDFFTDDDIDAIYAHAWEVHYQSARTGVRLIGPKPRWARSDGGEAGLHPSNIHDNAYAVGTIDFTGDMPVILGPDGPSLGGFVCPATLAQAELWKLGQLRPGDSVRFIPVSTAWTAQAERWQESSIATLRGNAAAPLAFEGHIRREPAVIERLEPTAQRVGVVYRRSGDKHLLIEYGDAVLDLDLRFRAHALMEWIERSALPGVIDLTPGIRSLQVHYDSRVLPLRKLMEILVAAEDELPANDDLELETRIVHLPLSWDDAATRLAIEKYMQVVRDDAPWCPSNLEFIARINGLAGVDAVRRIFFDASYLVLGLGDVYLGAPVATPIDPRHRLVTTKYNPARTWTPENAVGIGGAYLCVYGMEGPGGYQFVGRTVQMWNRHRATGVFRDGKPWLLRFFDQLRFYPVAHDELLTLREQMIYGTFEPRIETTRFKLREYHAFIRSIQPEAEAFKARQQAAFDAERARWEAAGEFEAAHRAEAGAVEASSDELILPEGASVAESELNASVWKVVAAVGAQVAAGDTLAVLEAMKMETPVLAPCAGTVQQVLCAPGQLVRPGIPLFVITP